MLQEKLLPASLSFLESASSYVVLIREYFPRGSDIYTIWRDRDTGCHEFCKVGGGGAIAPTIGESRLIQQPEIIRDGFFPCERYIAIFAELASIGVMSVPHDIKFFTSSHVKNTFLIRFPNGDSNYFRVPSGPSASEVAEISLKLISDLALNDFYWRLRNGDRKRPQKKE